MNIFADTNSEIIAKSLGKCNNGAPELTKERHKHLLDSC